MKEKIAINVQHIVHLIREERRLSQLVRQTEAQWSVDLARSGELVALKMEQQRRAEDSVRTAKRLIAVNFEEMAALRILERSLAESSRTREEGFTIKTQRQVVDQRIKEKMQERFALCKERKILVQRTTVEAAEMVALNVEISDAVVKKEEELAALAKEQEINTEYIEQMFEERIALQMEQQHIVEDTVRTTKERLALRVPREIVHDLGGPLIANAEGGRAVEEIGRRAWVWLDILIGG